MGEDIPAGWYSDPAGSGGWRWWDGGRWSGATRDAGQGGSEAPSPGGESAQGGGLAPAGWYADPSGYHAWRWWDGRRWTDAAGDAGESPATPASATAASPEQDSRDRFGEGTQSTSVGQPTPVRTSALTFGEAVSSVFHNFLVFQGRARRSEFWWYVLLQMVVMLVAYAIHEVVLVIVGAVLFLPYVSVAVRRMHDVGRSGAWVFWLQFAPPLGQLVGVLVVATGAVAAGFAIIVIAQVVVVVGGILAIVLLALPGRAEHNAYGPSPTHARG